MTRSFRKTPIFPRAKVESCKPYKKERAGKERAKETILIHEAKLGNEKAQADLKGEQAPWNEWACDRDGKYYSHDAKRKEMSK